MRVFLLSSTLSYERAKLLTYVIIILYAASCETCQFDSFIPTQIIIKYFVLPGLIKQTLTQEFIFVRTHTLTTPGLICQIEMMYHAPLPILFK